MKEQLCSSPPCFSQPNDHPHMGTLQVSQYASTFQNWEGNIHFMFAVMFNDMRNQQPQKSPPFARYQVEIISSYVRCLVFYLFHLRLFRNTLGYNTLKLLKKIALSNT